MPTTKPNVQQNRCSVRAVQATATAALLGAAVLSLAVISNSAAEPASSISQQIRFDDSSTFARSADAGLRNAVVTFIDGMAAGDAQTVWNYATEEDQAAFGTEQAVLHAFSEVFPEFAKAKEVTFESTWQEGDTPFVNLNLTEADGDQYRATMGLWIDDAGDWEIVSLEVRPAVDYVASLR